jgi:1,5-anhydro-D-fructose reductase (1,5-anhydro-D-mannitol-forming)
MSAAPLRWGLLGASGIAELRMVGAIRAAGGEVLAVASSQRERAEAFAARHGIPRAVVGRDALLADEDIQAVYVSTTNDRHHADVLAAAAARRHVLCEKPLAASLDDAEEMIAACARAGVVLGLNHHGRTLPWMAPLRTWLREGLVGRVEALQLTRHFAVGTDGWRGRDTVAGGATLDLTVHDADLVRDLTGDEVEAVQALAVGTPEHTVVGSMRTTGGTLVSFHDTLISAHAGTRLAILGETGAIVVNDGLSVADTTTMELFRDGVATPLPAPPYTNPYTAIVTAFTRAVGGDGRPTATAEDGFRAVQIALAVRDAARIGATVVVAPWSAGDGL